MPSFASLGKRFSSYVSFLHVFILHSHWMHFPCSILLLS
ncbi:unnamed protein product [Arabidopsis halleri]